MITNTMEDLKEQIQSKTILLVEDEPIIAMNQKLILEKFGYKVVTARDADRAFRALDDNPSFSLILMDINLGSGIDGTEAARKILKNWDLPIIFLSSHTEPEIINRIQSITSYGYVVKNSGYSILQNSIQMALNLFDTKKKLQGSENRYKSILSNIKDVILVLNRDLSVRYMNPNFEKYFGWKEKEILQSIFTFKLDSADRAFFEMTINEVSKREGLYKTIEVSLKDSTGLDRPISLTITNAYLTEGINGLLVNFHDLSEVKINENRLRRTDSLLRITQKLSKVGAWELDLATNKVFWTEETYRIHDLTLDIDLTAGEQWIQKSLTCYGPQDRELLIKALNDSIEKAIPYDLEFEFKSFKGICKWIRTVSEPIVIKGKVERIIGFIMDISHTKNIQMALQSKNEEFATVNEELTVTIEELEASNNELIKSNEEVYALGQKISKEKNFIDAILQNSPGFLAIFNESGELIQWNNHLEISLISPGLDLSLLSISSLIELENGMDWEEFFAELKLKRTLDLRYRLKQKQDSVITIQSNWVYYKNNETDVFLTIGFDKTALFAAESKLEESELKFKRVFEDAPLPMLIHTDDGKIEHVNSTLKELTGYSSDELKTIEDWTRLAYGIQQKEATEVIEDLYDLDGKKKDGEFTVRTKSGKDIVWDFSSASIGRLSDNRRAILSMANDVTERRQNEKRIESLLKEKDLILREVHHRIKNNMNTIHSLLSLQLSKFRDTKEGVVLQDAANRVQSMMLLYERLYKDSNFNSISIQSYLPNLVDQILLNFPNAFEVKVTKDIDDVILSVTKLQSIGILIYEILSNCMKYAFKDRSNCEIHFSAKLQDNIFTIIVRDNGIGFPEGMNHLNSKGFGLMLIDGLANQLGGELKFEKEKGTKVSLSFEIDDFSKNK
ncbi:MAG: PAS domain S-box protein [Leptospira sp.]|nr:PAS domain S-box protein [Leptospira sp.]